MRLGHVALADGEEAGESRFGGEKVVARLVEVAAVCPVGQAVPEAEQLAAWVVQHPEVHAVEQRGRPRREIAQAGGALVGRGVRRQQPRQRRSQRDERARQVAAVDRGDVGRLERRERLGVVPVEQVSFESLEAFDGRQRRVDARDQAVEIDEAQVVGGYDGEQSHRDVGRRRAMRHAHVGRHLDVVRRQRVIARSHERIEVAPGVERDRPQVRAVRVAERLALGHHRPAEIQRERGRAEPEEEHRQRRGKGSRIDREDGGADAGREQRARHHPFDERGGARQARPAGRDRRRLPLEEADTRDAHADQRHDDRVRHVVRLAREQDRLQGAPRRRQAELVQRGAPLAPLQQAAQQHHRLGDDGIRDRPQRDGRPGDRRARQHGPAGDEQRDRRRRQEAAPQVVEDLPARDERQPVAAPAVSRGHDGKQPPQNLPVAAHPAMLPLGVRDDAGGVVVDHFDVAHERRARVEALEQVV